MVLRLLRALTALVLVASGVMLHAASWQRWAGYCPWGSQAEIAACNTRMDHLYDFLLVGDPWEPIGTASELAGVSLLLVAFALVLLPCVLIEGRPGLGVTTAAGASALVVTNIGLATLHSGLTGEVVELVALFTYAIGPFDAAAWWEAYSGDLTALGGLCVLVAAVRRSAKDREGVPEAVAVA